MSSENTSRLIESIGTQAFRDKYEVKAWKYTSLLIEGKVTEGYGKGVLPTSRLFLGTKVYRDRCVWLAGLWDKYNGDSNTQSITFNIPEATPPTVTVDYTIGEIITLPSPEELGMILPEHIWFYSWEIDGEEVKEVTIKEDLELESITIDNSYIEFVVNVTSGSQFFDIPTYGGSVNIPFDWQVYVDGNLIQGFSGVSHASTIKITVSQLSIGEHTIRIEPSNGVTVGWGRAFGFSSSTAGFNITGNKNKLVRVNNDPDFAHLQFLTSTGANYRDNQYRGCKNLTYAVKEFLPNTVTYIGNYFRNNQYRESGIIDIPKEYIPNSVTTIGTYFRAGLYYNCNNISKISKEIMSNNIQQIGSYYRYTQYYNCANLIEIGTIMLEDIDKININGLSYRAQQFDSCSKLRCKDIIFNEQFIKIIQTFPQPFYGMFKLNVTNTTIDEMPKYYIDNTHTTTDSITTFTPLNKINFVYNRNGIIGFSNLHENWRL